jgi:hypothetical protein
MQLWLDDLRDPADYGKVGWHWARTAREALAWIAARNPEVTELSLDHDLGWESLLGFDSKKEETGYDVVLFLETHPRFWPKDGVHVHSSNPAGAKRMQMVIDRHYNRGEKP